MTTQLKFRASSAQRVALCPGSAHAEAGLPDRARAEEVSHGNLVHAVIAYHYGNIDGGTSAEALGEAESKLAAATEDQRREANETADILVARFEKAAGFKIAAGEDGNIRLLEALVEYRDWTGHPDMVLDHGGAFHVIDWKSGWQGTPDAADNAQTRVYALSCAARLPRMKADIRDDRVNIYIVTPGAVSVCEYDPDALLAADNELRLIVAAAQPIDAPRCPSTAACRYCRAFGGDRCPETRDLPATVPAANVEALETKLAAMPPRDIARLEDTCALIARLHAAARDEIKHRLELDPAAVPGYVLQKGRKSTKITDMSRAFALLGDVSQETFLTACKLSLPELAKAIARNAPPAMKITEAAARRRINDTLAPVIIEEVGSPILVRE